MLQCKSNAVGDNSVGIQNYVRAKILWNVKLFWILNISYLKFIRKLRNKYRIYISFFFSRCSMQNEKLTMKLREEVFDQRSEFRSCMAKSKIVKKILASKNPGLIFVFATRTQITTWCHSYVCITFCVWKFSRYVIALTQKIFKIS